MPDEMLPQRTLKTTFWLASLFTFLFGLRGDFAIAFGLAIGAAIGLSSLFSLIVVVPRLFRPGNESAKGMLGVVALLKLPIYAGVLCFAMTSPAIDRFSVFLGAALVPVVLVLKVVGYQMLQRLPEAGGEATCRSESTASN